MSLLTGPAITGQIVCWISAEATLSDSAGAAGSDFFLQPVNATNPASNRTASMETTPSCALLLFILFPFQNNILSFLV